jgi:methionine-gamma-lyase
MMEKPTQGLQTRLIHGGREANPTPAVSPPIFQTSTYLLATPEEGAALASSIAPAQFYGRDGSPNTKQVETLLADLEGAEAALVVGSGMAAITLAVMTNVQAGDHVVAQHTHYTSALTLLRQTLPG